MGNPILSYLVRWLVAHNFSRITICCGHLHQVIVDYFNEGAKFNAKIDYLIEEQPLGRGGALRQALQCMPDHHEPVLAMNGDMITNLNLSELFDKHKSSKALATLVTVPLVSQYGIVDIDNNGLVSGFREKPELPFWINAGIYVIEPSLVTSLPEIGDHETTTFPQLAQEGKLNAFCSNAFWRSIDTVKDLTDIQKECEQMFFGTLFQERS